MRSKKAGFYLRVLSVLLTLGFSLINLLFLNFRPAATAQSPTNPVTKAPTVITSSDATGEDVPGANLTPAVAPWNWKSVNSDYTAKFKEDVSAGQIVELSKEDKSLNFQPHALNWTNDLNQLEQISMPNSEATPNSSGNTMSWNNAYGTSRHLEFEAGTTKLIKNLIIDSFSDLPAPAQYIIDGGNPKLELNFIFTYSAGIDVLINGSVWDKKSQTDTNLQIDFIDSTAGELLWSFEKPIYQDVNGDLGIGMTRLKKQGGSFYVSIQVPYSWLQTATYPIKIDPTVITTSSRSTATAAPTQRKIVRTSDGILHAFVASGSNAMTCQQPAPAGSKNGFLWVKSSDGGTTWSCEGQIRPGASANPVASAVVDSNDNIYVVYPSNITVATNDINFVFYRKLTKGEGSTWVMEDEQTVLDADLRYKQYSYPVIELEGDTRIWLAAKFFDDAMGVTAVAWNSTGNYWLIGGQFARLDKYDNTTYTEAHANLSGWSDSSHIEAITWNGTNFLIGGTNKELNLCDSSLSCTDVSSKLTAFGSSDDILAIGWNGTNWLVGGQSSKLMECNSAVTSCTNKSSSLIGWSSRVTAIAWNSTNSYWLIGGGSASLNKYDGSTFTDKKSSLVNWGSGDIFTIDWDSSDNYFLIGGPDKRLNKYNGPDDVITDVASNLDANWASTDDIYWIRFGGSNWLISGYNQFSKCTGALSCTAVTTTALHYVTADWDGTNWLIGSPMNPFGPVRIYSYVFGTSSAINRLKEYDLTNVTDVGSSLVDFGDDYRRVNVYYSSNLSASPTWTLSATLDTPGSSSSTHIPAIVRFGSNTGVIYTDNSGNIKWRTRADSDGLTSWNAEANVGTGETVKYSSIAKGSVFSATVDDSNQVHVTYITSVGTDVNYTFYNGSSWSTPISLATSNISDSTGAQITTDGTSVWVIWNDGSNGLNFSSSVKGKLSYKKGVSPFTSSDFETDPTAVNSADRIYDQVWTYISSSYTDETTDAGNQTSADVAMPSVVDDIIYFGMTEKFRAVSWNLSTYGSGGIVAWEYYNGASWTNLTLIKYSNRYFTVSTKGTVYFDSPSDWTQIQVDTDASPGFYYVRARVTADYSTTPVGTQMAAIPGSIAVSAIAKFSTSRAYLIWAETAVASSPVNVQFAYIATNQNPNSPSSLGPSALVDESFGTDNTPTLTFTLDDPDETEQVKYQIQIDNNSDFSSVVVDYASAFQNEGSASFTVGQAAGSGSYTTGSEGQTLSDGSYYWRVKTIDDDNAESAYTTANSGNIAFKVDTTTPADFELQDPSDKNYTNNTQPNFSFKKSSDPTSGLAKYQLIIDEGKDGSFTIDDIPISGGSDYQEETTSFKATYENEDDGDSTNDVIKIEIKGEINTTVGGQDTKVWPLKEGKRSWSVKAIDNLSNTRTSTRTLNIDLTAPSLSELAIANEQLIVGGGSYATNLRQPAFSGKITDSFSGEKIAENNQEKEASGPEKVEIEIEKETISGTGIYSTYLTGSVNVEEKSETTEEKTGRFYYALTQVLPDGRYKVTLGGKDGAGNTGRTTFNLRIGPILPPEELEMLIEEIAEEEEIPKEEIEEIIKEEGIIVPEELKPPSKIVEGIGKALSRVSKVWWSLVEKGRKIINTGVILLAQVGNRFPRLLKLWPKAARYAFYSVFAPASEEIKGFAQRVNIATSTFLVILFDREPTRISDLKVEEVSPTQAVITWKTNHYATSKVNYGFSTTYGKDAYSAERVKEHQIVLTDLEPGKTYYFEVMSQNKNYAFDAYYTFTTPLD